MVEAYGLIYPGGTSVGYFQIRMSGGGDLDLTSSLEAKFGARSGQVHQIRGKIWESSVTTRRKSWEKVPILESYLKFRGQNLGYLSFIFLEAKFGAPTRISEANFGAKPPRPPNMEVPPGLIYPHHSGENSTLFLLFIFVVNEICNVGTSKI